MKIYAILVIVPVSLFFTMSCGTGSTEKPATKSEKVDVKKVFSTKLTTAAEKGDLALVKEMIEAGVDINQKTSYSQTALMRAIEMRHEEVVEYLLSKNPDLYVTDIYGMDAEGLANDKNDKIKELVKKAVQEHPKVK
jgi:ankyrin repeat protein